MTADAPGQTKVVCRFSSIGDIVLSTGPLLRWHQELGLSFIYITRREFAPLLDGHPAVQEVVGLERDSLSGSSLLNTARLLAQKYAGSALIDLHGNIRSAVLKFFWQGTVKSYPKASLRRRIYLHSGRKRLGKGLSLNVAQRYSLALESSPPPPEAVRPVIFLNKEEKERASDLLNKALSGSGPLVALHPYATHPAKTWPAERWLELAGGLRTLGCRVFIVGRGGPLYNGPADFSNQTNLRGACALLAQADLLITGDSGPMHLASAVGCPALALFGPTVKAWGFQPFGQYDRVLELPMSCRPCSLHGQSRDGCGQRCLMDIGTEQTIEQAREMLARKSPED